MGYFFESYVKQVRITLSRSILETIFGLKFIDNAPSHLTQKLAKEFCLSQFAHPQKLAVYAPLIMFSSWNLGFYITCLLGSFTPKTIPRKPQMKLALKLFIA